MLPVSEFMNEEACAVMSPSSSWATMSTVANRSWTRSLAASDGLEGLRRSSVATPTLVLLDHTMPRMDVPRIETLPALLSGRPGND